MKLTKMTLSALFLMPLTAGAQQILTLEACREMAVASNTDLKIAQQKIKIDICTTAGTFP